MCPAGLHARVLQPSIPERGQLQLKFSTSTRRARVPDGLGIDSGFLIFNPKTLDLHNRNGAVAARTALRPVGSNGHNPSTAGTARKIPADSGKAAALCEFLSRIPARTLSLEDRSHYSAPETQIGGWYFAGRLQITRPSGATTCSGRSDRSTCMSFILRALGRPPAAFTRSIL